MVSSDLFAIVVAATDAAPLVAQSICTQQPMFCIGVFGGQHWQRLTFRRAQCIVCTNPDDRQASAFRAERRLAHLSGRHFRDAPRSESTRLDRKEQIEFRLDNKGSSVELLSRSSRKLTQVRSGINVQLGTSNCNLWNSSKRNDVSTFTDLPNRFFIILQKCAEDEFGLADPHKERIANAGCAVDFIQRWLETAVLHSLSFFKRKLVGHPNLCPHLKCKFPISQTGDRMFLSPCSCRLWPCWCADESQFCLRVRIGLRPQRH